MEGLYIDLGKEGYTINIGGGLLDRLEDFQIEAEGYLIITDENVDRLYSEGLYKKLQQPIFKYVIPPGESSKTLETVSDILNFMLGKKLTRRAKILALGGGVVGDLAGFVASVYMRGIDYIQIPTTLLAQVDSSVGGKTGINMPQGKNLVGSFYQPIGVMIDTEVLKTLPKKEVISGVGEILKYGFIYDYSFLTYLKRNIQSLPQLDPQVLEYTIRRCCEIKAEVVAQDEKEKGLRKILNFGHTIGHGLEAVTAYKTYTHGEAVILGMELESEIAHKLGLIEGEYLQEIKELLKGCNVPMVKISLKALIDAMEGDKKNQQAKISFILPTGRGRVEEVLLTPTEVKELLTNINIGGDLKWVE